jgi:LAS superfamily LD-carboxypeptidase LdcB
VTPTELTGRSRGHIVDLVDPPCALHAHVTAPFSRLRYAAADAGFDLVPQSSHRDFDRQLRIWNAKFNGEAAVNDPSGRALDALALTPPERIRAILHWSALPGASRHHWGTDLDLIDRKAVAAGYRVQLIASEYAPSGPFGSLAAWLEANAARFGFFRPFRGVLSGVEPEPWHFSFAPVAESARRALTPALLRDALREAPLAGKEEVLERLEDLHARYVASIDWP